MTSLAQSSPRGWIGKALVSLADSILVTVEGWRERSRLRRELDALGSAGELMRTLADSGIGLGDVPRLLRAHPHTAQQLDQMMHRLDIDRAALPHGNAIAAGLRDIEWQCGDCADWRKCRAWLASPGAAESHRAFCPNAEALDQLRSAAAPAQPA